jgi:triacylglycerol lipase
VRADVSPYPVHDFGHPRAWREDRRHAHRCQWRAIRLWNDAAAEDDDVVGSLSLQQVDDPREQRHVGAREDRQADRVSVLGECRAHDLLRRLVQPGVNHLHAGIAEGAGHNLGAAIMTIQSRFGHHDPQRRGILRRLGRTDVAEIALLRGHGTSVVPQYSGRVINMAVGGVAGWTRGMPRTASGLAVEVAWISAHLMMYPLGILAEPVRKGRPGRAFSRLSPQQRAIVHEGVEVASTPILLIHGIVDNHSVFAVLDRALRRRGFRNLAWFDYGLLTRDVRGAAEELAVAIDRLTAESGYERIHVIGHSLGGLIARYYVQRLGGDQRVHSLITLGTPHSGTLLARAGQALPLVRQLAPGSELLNELAEPATCSTRFVAFYSDLDHVVVPSRNARIDHPDLSARNVAVRGVGHLSMPNNGRIAFQITSALRELHPHKGSSLVEEPRLGSTE